MISVYILRCCDSSLYVGLTSRLAQRISEHRDGVGSVYTAKKRPIALVYWEEYDSEDAAIARERQLKGWTRAKKEALIAGDREQLKLLSKRRRY